MYPSKEMKQLSQKDSLHESQTEEGRLLNDEQKKVCMFLLMCLTDVVVYSFCSVGRSGRQLSVLLVTLSPYLSLNCVYMISFVCNEHVSIASLVGWYLL